MSSSSTARVRFTLCFLAYISISVPSNPIAEMYSALVWALVARISKKEEGSMLQTIDSTKKVTLSKLTLYLRQYCTILMYSPFKSVLDLMLEVIKTSYILSIQGN